MRTLITLVLSYKITLCELYYNMLFRKEAFTRQTVGKHVGKLLATNRACLYSRQLFHQLLRKLVFDV